MLKFCTVQGQLMTHNKREVVNTAAQLFQLQQQTQNEIRYYRKLSDNSAMVVLAPKAETVGTYQFGNVLLVSQICSMGRVMLNRLLYRSS